MRYTAADASFLAMDYRSSHQTVQDRFGGLHFSRTLYVRFRQPKRTSFDRARPRAAVHKPTGKHEETLESVQSRKGQTEALVSQITHHDIMTFPG